jgi:hypothetical protein
VKSEDSRLPGKLCAERVRKGARGPRRHCLAGRDGGRFVARRARRTPVGAAALAGNGCPRGGGILMQGEMSLSECPLLGSHDDFFAHTRRLSKPLSSMLPSAAPVPLVAQCRPSLPYGGSTAL